MRNRRTFSREFKLSVLREIENGKTIAEICRKHKLHPSTVGKWKDKYRKDPAAAFAGNGNEASDNAKIAELEQLVGQLFVENAFLKKTLSTLEKKLQENRKKGGLS